MRWEYALHLAIRRYTRRHGSMRFSRRGIIEEELGQIIEDTGTNGSTPHQTLSRTLQLLRDQGLVYFANNDGDYIFLEKPIVVEDQELSDFELDNAIYDNRLLIGTVETSSEVSLARSRRGQDRLRQLVLRNYGYRCAVCDISDRDLLVASHIVRWADDPTSRGDLSNVLCLCKFHDILFECGYFALSDRLSIVKRSNLRSRMLQSFLGTLTEFTATPEFPPAPNFLRRHRDRTGHSEIDQ